MVPIAAPARKGETKPSVEAPTGLCRAGGQKDIFSLGPEGYESTCNDFRQILVHTRKNREGQHVLDIHAGYGKSENTITPSTPIKSAHDGASITRWRIGLPRSFARPERVAIPLVFLLMRSSFSRTASSRQARTFAWAAWTFFWVAGTSEAMWRARDHGDMTAITLQAARNKQGIEIQVYCSFYCGLIETRAGMIGEDIDVWADSVLVLLELTALIYGVISDLSLISVMIPFLLTVVFRVATIRAAKEPFFAQNSLYFTQRTARDKWGEGVFITIFRPMVMLFLLGVTLYIAAIYVVVDPLDATVYTQGIASLALLPGSNLFGIVYVTANIPWSSHDVDLTPQVTALQQNASTTGLNSSASTLTLIQPNPGYIITWTQETRNHSVLSGISSLGGFLSIISGVFTLIFGADILYFAFGRRQLSAFGMVHIFQKRKFVRRWNEDFPALHTEGGQPGSETAGIVAFLRERLVDVGENPHQDDASREAARLLERLRPNLIEFLRNRTGDDDPHDSEQRSVGTDDIEMALRASDVPAADKSEIEAPDEAGIAGSRESTSLLQGAEDGQCEEATVTSVTRLRAYTNEKRAFEVELDTSGGTRTKHLRLGRPPVDDKRSINGKTMKFSCLASPHGMLADFCHKG
ncbi:hypothetical protein FB45DRAFT_1137715 [Roridomyces roridus]|uniref:Uncharacterized protein n=1 Tax=Roridomyces roridus TaxID=1738132 RepID=A0AAD7C2L2_9AGAR|nr:hypothetical protein FB45DRAFT_1137715 [Roridomyces roridus]